MAFQLLHNYMGSIKECRVNIIDKSFYTIEIFNLYDFYDAKQRLFKAI